MLPAVILGVMGYRYRWFADDGLTVARTVRQILAGNGPVFNIGERVEVNTSALWTWLLTAIAFVTRLNVYTVMLLMSLVLSPAGLLLAADGSRRLYGARTRWLFPAGALVVAALPAFWEFTTSGLESPLVFFWLGLSWWLLVRIGPRSAGVLPYAGAFTWGLGWLVRPEMAMVTVVFAAAGYLVLRPSGRRAAALAAAGLALPGAYQLFRMGYYAAVVPNTAITKSAGSLVADRGWAYLVNYAGPYLLWIPALLLALLLAQGLAVSRLPLDDRIKITAALVAGLLLGGYVVAIGGDFMHARMLMPATFLLLAPVMILPVPDLVTRRRVLAFGGLGACLAAWALCSATALRLPDAAQNNANGVADERSASIGIFGSLHPDSPVAYLHGRNSLLGPSRHPSSFAVVLLKAERVGRPVWVYWANQSRPPWLAPLRSGLPDTVAVNGPMLGRLGAGVPLNTLVIDDFGLAYPLGSHLMISARGRAGHEKRVPMLWETADYGAPGYIAGGSAAEVDAARAALHCGELAQLQAAVRAPLTWDRFWDNVLHAYSFTRMEIPPDPVAAEHQFCG